MSLSFVPQRHVKKQNIDMETASRISREKWGQAHITGPGLSEFLSGHGVQNLFLTTTSSSRMSLRAAYEKWESLLSLSSRDPSLGTTLLVESSTVGEKWGTQDIAVDLSGMPAAQSQDWLRAAASFSGAVYLVNLTLTSEDNMFWWKALSASRVTSPRTLFFMYHCELTHLVLALKRNRSIQNLTLFRVNLSDKISSLMHAISLTSLHLVDVGLTRDHLEALCHLDSPPVTQSLAIEVVRSRRELANELEQIRYGGITSWDKSITNILQWPLKQLTVIGVRLANGSLIDFIQKCTHSSLHSMVLEVVPPSDSGAKAKLVRAVVDALHNSGLPYLDLIGLQDAAIEAQLLANQRRLALKKLSGLKKQPAVAVRLFICGDAYAGKTTLLSTLSSVCSQVPMLKKKALALIRGVKSCLKQHDYSSNSERTRGIEVHAIMKDGIRLSAWDMAGQTEFHAFHDHMIPDPSTNLGSSAMFLFVWSPIDSKNEERGGFKEKEDFEASFSYWLKFIASKTRQSNILRKIIVVLTRKDQIKWMQDVLVDSINSLAARFQETIEVVKVMEVDARNPVSVTPLASCIFETAKDVLNGAEVYNVCSKMSKFLSSTHTQKSLIRDPIISWDAFSGKLCNDKFNVSDLEVQKAIAYSLNESGDLIYLSNLPFLVLDPNWFCHEVMGRLIYFPHSDTFSGYIPKDGYLKQNHLEKILGMSTHDKVEGSLLVSLMEAMNLCCKVPDDTDGTIFIPATLVEVSTSELQLQWRGATSASTQEYAYVGLRLECDRKDLTFFTQGLFPMIQVVFRKAFLESNADVKNGRGFMSICVEDIEIMVEFGLANGQHVIDVMVRAPDRGDVRNTLAYVEEEIIKTLIRVCAQREGNQGVKLVVGVIRPDCLWVPSPSHVREEQSVLILDLKQELRKKL